MTCNGICQRYKTRRGTIGGRYKTGQKRCKRCDLFMDYDGLRCPCCKSLFKVTRRDKKYEEKYRKRVQSISEYTLLNPNRRELVIE